MLDLNRFKKEKEFYLRVKVFPGSDKNEIRGLRNDNIDGNDVETLLVSIKSLADKNKANEELVKFLSSLFLPDKIIIKIISGSTSRVKLLKISKN